MTEEHRRSAPHQAADPLRYVLLTAFVVLAVTSLVQKSPTFDEPYHLCQGFRYLRTGDPSLRLEKHPPGVQALAALPLLFVADSYDAIVVSDPRHYLEAGGVVRRFTDAHDGRILDLFPYARGIIVLLAAVLGWFVYSVARDLYGRGGARLALVLFVVDPNILAHARLVTTDIGVALGVWLTVAALLRWATRPTALRAATVGVTMGCAFLAKFSCLLLLPLLPILALVLVVGRDDRPAARAVLSSGLLALVLAGSIVWMAHGFDFGSLAEEREGLKAGAVSWRTETRGRQAGEGADETSRRWYEEIPILAPEYFNGFLQNLHHVYERGHTAYFRGEHSLHGWRLYFPVVFGIKTPLPTLILLLAALLSLLRWRPSREEWILIIFPVVYFAAAVRGSLNIGYRHLLPMLPFLFVLTGRLWGRVSAVRPGTGTDSLGKSRRASVGSVAIVVLLLWLGVGTIRAHPHYLAYFNETIGGSSRGYRYVVDANLDWGQDLPGLAKWLQENGVDTVRLSYFGSVNPSHYGIHWLPAILPARRAEDEEGARFIPPGVYAISVANLFELQSLGKGSLRVFQQLEPRAVIGHSIHVYVVNGGGDA
jgi:hypothetical protein